MIRSLVLLILAVICLGGATRLQVTDFSLLNSMLWSLLGLIAGVVIASATFFLTVIETIREQVITATKDAGGDGTAVERVNVHFNAAVGQMRQDIQVVFVTTLFAIILVLWGQSDVPYFAWKITCITKIQFVYGVITFGVFLALWSAWDIVDMMFALRSINSGTKH